MSAFNFAYVAGQRRGKLAAVEGERPKGIQLAIRSETDFVFVLYRTQLLNPGDIENVKKVQAASKVQALSQFLGGLAPAAPPSIE